MVEIADKAYQKGMTILIYTLIVKKFLEVLLNQVITLPDNFE
jgi:hypothetical protein